MSVPEKICTHMEVQKFSGTVGRVDIGVGEYACLKILHLLEGT